MKKMFNLISKCVNKEIVLIYTMGKVGSSSLENNIPGSFHLHSLYNNPPNPLHWELRNYGLFRKISIRFRNAVRRYIYSRAKSVKIISIVRDPLDRNISMYFQALPFWLSVAQSGYKTKSHIDSRKEGFDVIVQSFENYYNHQYCLTWFDKELKRFSGIDVYSRKFDKENGVDIFQNGKYECLILSLEKLNNSSSIISEFLGRNVNISSENSGERKWYADIYRKFKTDYKPSEKLNRLIYNSKYYCHFFR